MSSPRVDPVSPGPVEDPQPSLAGPQRLSGDSHSCCQAPRLGGKPHMEPTTLTPVGELPWYNCSPACVGCPPIRYGILPPSHCVLFFVLGCGNLFWWAPESSCHGCSAISCDFGALLHLSVDGHLCFRVLALVNSAAMNMEGGASIFLNYSFFHIYIQE